VSEPLTFQQLYDQLNALTATNAALTLELTKHRQQLAVHGDLLKALTEALKGGVVVPPTQPPPVEPPVEPPPPTQTGWGTQGRFFTRNGVKEFPKIVSVRAAAFTIENNKPHVLNYFTGSAHQNDLIKTLSTARACGVDVVRFYGSISTYPDGRKGTDTDYCIRRSREVLDLLAAQGMFGLVVLDENATSGLGVYDGMHDGHDGRPTSWYETGHEQVYLKHVEDMVHGLSDHPAYWGCTLGNEYHLREQTTKGATAVYNFLLKMGRRVKQLNRGKFCFVDNETLWQLFAGVGNLTEQFVKTAYEEKIFTGLTLHVYNPRVNEPLGENTRLGDAPNRAESVDIALATKYPMPVLVTEMGVTRSLENPINAAPILTQWIAYMKSLGIAGGGWWLLVDSINDGDLGWHDDASIDNAPNGHRYDWNDMLKALAAISS
jgi:hypothetical protein